MIKSLRRYRYRLLLIVLMVTIAGISCSAGAGLDISSHQLTVRQFTGDLNSTRSVAIVTGEARNTGRAVINNPVIEVIFYDAQKNIIGSASASREFLEPDQTWNFTAQLTSPDAWKAREYRIKGSAK